ncbi:winged helix-turn-helix transcriptional regulator [Yinghuangia soli]|uniref:Helix-turn-helix transcriptional regulator n=1 Tax=Yinghuangia soli TaxID=2908204 RepID=A0AA41U155_9ACTN|nr:helix-turn-helix domain-containing protein [Yinghuangia soli]MCF2529291.1 helix-turn-helix transcriptional regulator [Yinghuangia soli]
MRGRHYSSGLEAAVDVVGGKWKALVLRALHAEPRRFGELKKDVAGITERELIEQLRELEGDGIVHREIYHQVPPMAEYSLTALGQELNTALDALGVWGTRHMDLIEERRFGIAAVS